MFKATFIDGHLAACHTCGATEGLEIEVFTPMVATVQIPVQSKDGGATPLLSLKEEQVYLYCHSCGGARRL